ncbi:MAG TPA: NAD-dependent epimerase/dehydratase family protein [Pyrinomonadaceae bacterium]|jgi:dihydroflavonol-4-reductase|nr:NAD-dependent epimerase/dehydratase family protein [Pyrinomonadaceae bacterium]
MATTTKKAATRKAAAKKAKAKSTTSTLARKGGAIARRAAPKTLVTGGTGFLGTHLVRQLLEAGTENVRVMATSVPSKLKESGVEPFEGSITNAADVRRSVEGVTEIYHLAGRVSRDSRDARQMMALHVDGTRLLCAAAREAGVKSIVVASTSGTIAVTEDGEERPDETWPPPLDIISRWPYYASKYYQEQVALENFSGRGLRLVILNPSLLLGPEDERLSSTKVILDFLARKINAVPRGGLSFVDVRDAATAFRRAMQVGKHGERYLLGSANWTFEKFLGRLERLSKTPGPRLSLPKSFTVAGSKLVDALFRQWNMAPPIEAESVEMAEYFWYLDASKAQRELGFAPRDPAETLNDTLVYVRENFLGSEAFKAASVSGSQAHGV